MDPVEEYAKKVESFLGPGSRGSDLFKELIEDYKEGCAECAEEAAAEDPGNWHVRATPLLDVLCVSVHRHKPDDSEIPFEICGTIQLIADENYAYDVYRRELDNPEIVSPGGNLPLTLPDGSPSCIFLPCASAFKMRVHLRDAAQGKEIANQIFNLELMNYDYEKIITRDVLGHDGFASIVYATLPYAVIANVELRLSKKDQTDSYAHIYGTISATSKVIEGSISSILFERPPCEPIKVGLKTPLRLSRSMFAVPAYSSLQIKADLWDHLTNKQIASDVVVANSQAHDYHHLIEQDCILGQNYHVKVKIHWTHAYVQLFDEGSPIHKPQLLCDQEASSALSNRGPMLYLGELLKPPPPIKPVFGSILVELFSISICPNSDVNSPLYGKIEVYDAKGSFNIFQRDYSSKKECLVREMKLESLEWPSRPLTGTYFGLDLHLTDGEGREICKGYFYWDVCRIDFPISWYMRRIASVIRGEHGYATVHYTINLNAVQATVKVLLVPNSSCDVPFKVGGSVVARYTSYAYSSLYESKFYRSTLLGDNRCTVLAPLSPLMLQKSVVSVPGSSALILEVNLQARPINDINNAKQCIQTLQEEVKFNIDVNNTSFKMIKGNDFHVIVFVEWNNKLY